MQPGDRVHHYRLVRPLGRGGQGTVWLATRDDGRGMATVALKLARSGRSLAREARLAGLLRHPNLVDVYEVGEDRGQWFCALELCTGGAVGSGAPLSPAAIVEVGLAVCAALGYAHEELDLVHLDLKPDNLLLHRGVVKVADLGLASARGFDAVRGGTPGFMAPEQTRGGPVDPRTDVWALGRVLLSLATGRRSPDGTTFVLDADQPPVVVPSDADPVGPAWLAPVLARCLTTDPEDRFRGVAELADALRGLAPGASADVPTGRAASVAGPTEGGSEDFGEIGAIDVNLSADDAGYEPVPDAPADGPEDPLIGRDRELRAVAAALAAPGIAVVRGPPGVGKSCLAREAARIAAVGPTTAVDLARAVGDDALRRVAVGLGVTLEGAADPAQRIGAALRAREDLVLLLDAVDHWADAPAVAERWCAIAPRLRILLTARRQLPGLCPIDLAPLTEDAAAALFVARAGARGAVVPADDPVVRDLVRRLDGLPLAIELAAGRLGVLTPRDVLDRLSPRFLRSARAEDATLAEAIGWSVDALDPPDREAFAALALFRGSFGDPAAAAVLGRVDASDVLARLVGCSLAVCRGDRFALLAPVRACAEQLTDGRAAAEERHGQWCASLDPAADATVGAVDDLAFGIERAVLRGDPATAAAAFAVAATVLARVGPASEVAPLAAVILAMPDLPDLHRATVCAHAALARLITTSDAAASSSAARAADRCEAAGAWALACDVLLALTGAYRVRGEIAEASIAAERARDLGRRLGDPLREASGRARLARVWLGVGRVDEARAELEAARAACPGSTEVAKALALVLTRSGEVHAAHALYLAGEIGHDDRAVCLYLLGRVDEAIGVWRERAPVHERVGDLQMLGGTLSNLGWAISQRGETSEAEALLRRGLACHRETGDLVRGGDSAVNLGLLLAKLYRFGEAVEAYGWALEAFRAAGARGDEGGALSCLAVALDHLDHPDARRCAETAVATLDRCGDRPLSAARARGNLGCMLVRTGHVDEGLRRLEGAIAGAPSALRTQLGTVLEMLAEARVAAGRPHDALAPAEEAVAVARSGGFTAELSTALSMLACAQAAAGAAERASATLAEAEALAEASPDRECAVEVAFRAVEAGPVDGPERLAERLAVLRQRVEAGGCAGDRRRLARVVRGPGEPAPRTSAGSGAGPRR